jgi:hypothetical protein
MFASVIWAFVSILVSIRVGRRLPQVRTDLGGHVSQHVAGDVLVQLGEGRVGPAHDLHRGPVGHAELRKPSRRCGARRAVERRGTQQR